MPTPLMLGPVAFVGFEIPERVRFGGRQRLAIHRLPGGRRIIDAMGRDDAEIAWAGIFSGPDAAERARTVDALRVSGTPIPLTWDAFLYTVVVSSLEADYSSPWWIPYRLACTVVQDEAQVSTEAPALASAIASDLSEASVGADVSALEGALNVTEATVPGTAAYLGAVQTAESTKASIEDGLASASAGLVSADFSAVVQASGQIAQLARARGFVARTAANLGNAAS